MISATVSNMEDIGKSLIKMNFGRDPIPNLDGSRRCGRLGSTPVRWTEMPSPEAHR